MKRYVSIVCILLVIIGGCVGTYFITAQHYKQINQAARLASLQTLVTYTKAAQDKQKALDASSHKTDVTKLEVCINNGQTSADLLSCFRKEAVGILPEPTIDDYNKLPNLY